MVNSILKQLNLWIVWLILSLNKQNEISIVDEAMLTGESVPVMKVCIYSSLPLIRLLPPKATPLIWPD
jgi:magnesium-transporting ATPase (P-type)